MRKKVIAGNWKMYKGELVQAAGLAQGVAASVGQQDKVGVVLCPPATALSVVVEAVKGTCVKVGGQNIYPRVEGAFTGEISPAFLQAVGCEYVIIGHSERRTYFAESDDFINQKVRAALDADLKPILCCGETQVQRDQGITQKVVKQHITGGLADISAQEMADVIIAYEPVWAIGTGKTATPADAQEVHAFIRGLLTEMFGPQVAQATVIQYGGSVKPDNAKDLLTQPDIDGALVGGASLKIDDFVAIVKYNG